MIIHYSHEHSRHTQSEPVQTDFLMHKTHKELEWSELTI